MKIHVSLFQSFVSVALAAALGGWALPALAQQDAPKPSTVRTSPQSSKEKVSPQSSPVQASPRSSKGQISPKASAEQASPRTSGDKTGDGVQAAVDRALGAMDAAAAKAAEEKSAKEPLAANPFAYNLPTDSKGFIPDMEGEIPTGIRVEGIMCFKDGEALAALSVPGHDDLYYVRENDVIALGGQPGSAGGGDGITYIQVGEIGQREVELYPKANPSNIHIIR